MIKNRADLKEYLSAEKQLYVYSSFKDRVLEYVTNMPDIKLWQYMKLLRRTEYHYNKRHGNIYHSLMYLFVRRRKNILGYKLGIEIWENSCGKGLRISHYGNIVINGDAHLGEYCVLHGANCLGNTGLPGEKDAPTLGNHVDIGVGASIIGGVSIADNVRIGAGAVVVDSCSMPGAVLVGVPAQKRE